MPPRETGQADRLHRLGRVAGQAQRTCITKSQFSLRCLEQFHLVALALATTAASAAAATPPAAPAAATAAPAAAAGGLPLGLVDVVPELFLHVTLDNKYLLHGRPAKRFRGGILQGLRAFLGPKRLAEADASNTLAVLFDKVHEGDARAAVHAAGDILQLVPRALRRHAPRKDDATRHKLSLLEVFAVICLALSLALLALLCLLLLHHLAEVLDGQDLG
mmetsp:Transcript_14512/g.36742  ORF Transcript_14512/g.36742 Transcript_14512/m.36742 type:complete len:219 (-) Transcript_14512:874-1530(-)